MGSMPFRLTRNIDRSPCGLLGPYQNSQRPAKLSAAEDEGIRREELCLKPPIEGVPISAQIAAATPAVAFCKVRLRSSGQLQSGLDSQILPPSSTSNSSEWRRSGGLPGSWVFAVLRGFAMGEQFQVLNGCLNREPCPCAPESNSSKVGRSRCSPDGR